MTTSPFKDYDIKTKPHQFFDDILIKNSQKLSSLSEIATSSINSFINLCKDSIREEELPMEGKLNEITIFQSCLLQYDSIGDEYYIPLRKKTKIPTSIDSLSLNDEYTNSSIFKRDDVFAESSCIDDGMLSRKMLIVNWKGKEVLVYYYGSEEFSLNTQLDIVGILSKQDEDHVDGGDIGYPHCLQTVHAISMKPSPPPKFLSAEDISKSRMIFLDHLPKPVMMSLLSNLNSRVNGIVSSLLIGYYPLNIKIGPNCSNGKEILSLLERISSPSPTISGATIIPINPSYLENTFFESRLRQDGDDSCYPRLLPGRLQKEGGHVFIIDELNLKEGDQFKEGALKQFAILQEFVIHQRISYVIEGLHNSNSNNLPPLATIPMNNPVIIVSNGGSIVAGGMTGGSSGDKIDSVSIDSDIPTINEEEGFVEEISKFISYCRSLVSSVSIDEDLANSLVENPSLENGFDATAFSEILNLARLVCASHGRMDMRMEDYLEAKEMIY